MKLTAIPLGSSLLSARSLRMQQGRALFLALATTFLAVGANASAIENALLPAPKQITAAAGEFVLRDGMHVGVPAGDKDAQQVARYLIDLLGSTRGIHLQLDASDTKTPAPIQLTRSVNLKGEAYRVTVGPNGIALSAGERAGLLYAATSLWQLATVDTVPKRATIPAVTINDEPRFQWRGVMLDSVRHFQSPEFVKKLIDTMAVHRLNVLHWHLTDDQGWRIEIKKYPKLTEVAAWRVPAGAGPLSDIDTKTGKPRLYGGFYTQAQAREIVAYAADRNITIVPEIEMPGHASAAIVAYPQFGVTTPPSKVPSDWGVFYALFNADDATVTFLKDVLTEVMEVFPSKYIHIGGDEAVKDQWKASPAIQARMKALNIKTENALQSWINEQMEAHLNAHGRRLIGWDEILEGGLAANATVMSWRGIEGAIAASKQGHDTVLAAWPTLYLDNRQSLSADEPPGRGEARSVKDVYAFDPIPAAVSEGDRKHILGVQANLWTEHVRTERQASLMYFPRVAALADIAWAPAEQHDWPRFANRMQTMLHRYDLLGVTYNAVPFQVQAKIPHDLTSASVPVTLSTAVGLGEIRYTLDGKAPTANSTLYTAPVIVKRGQAVYAGAFLNGQPLTAPVRRQIDEQALTTRRAHDMKFCRDAFVLAQEDDASRDGSNKADDRAVLVSDLVKPCWIFEAADLTGITQIEALVGQRPYNFQLGEGINDVKFNAPATKEGELEVRIDSCTGAVVATLPLAPAAKSNGITALRGKLPPQTGRHDLCFTFTSSGVGPENPNPLWLLDRVRLAKTR